MALVVFMRAVNVIGHRTFRPPALAKELAAFDVVNLGAAGGWGRIFEPRVVHTTTSFDGQVLLCV